MIWVEALATVAGLLCVGFLIRQSIWTWPFGLLQVTLYIFIFHQVKLYSDLILHVIYVVLQLYGWYHWVHGGRGHGRLPVTTLSRAQVVRWTGIALLASAGWGTLMARATDAALPYGDAFTMMTSLVAQWLTNRKKVESWVFWIAVDVVAIGVFYAKDLYFTVGLYAVFLMMSVAGWLEWRRAIEARDDESRSDAGEIRPAAPWPSAGD